MKRFRAEYDRIERQKDELRRQLRELDKKNPIGAPRWGR